MKQAKNNEMSLEEVKFGNGPLPDKARWPFAQLKKGKYFEVTNLNDYVALRAATSRAAKRLKMTLKVRTITLKDGTQVLRVYRE